MAKQTPYGWLCLFGCYDKHHRKQSAFQGQAIPFPLWYEEAFFSGKVSDFLASFPEKKNWALFGFVCGKEGFENWMERFCELLEKRTTNYRGFKDRTEAMEKASFCLRE